MDVMKKSIQGGREPGGDAGHPFHLWKLIPEGWGVFFFLIWLAKRTLQILHLQILHGCFDVRACIAGWNNGNMWALPKSELWLSPDIKVGAKNSLEVFSMYGSCCSSSQRVHHGNWQMVILTFNICVSASSFIFLNLEDFFVLQDTVWCSVPGF